MAVDEKPRCVGKTKAGKPCRSFTVTGSEYCMSHSQTAEERSAAGQKARRAGIRAKRLRDNPLYDHAENARARLPLIYDGLRAEIREIGWPVQPDLRTRLIALFVLVILTGAYEDPATVYTKLNEMIPPELRPQPMPTFEQILANARREWDDAGRAEWSSLTGIVPQPYPVQMLPQGMTMEQAVAEGKQYLASVYGDPEEVPGLDSHVRATVIATGQPTLIRRTPLNAVAA